MDEIKISVIIPIFNMEKSLKSCLDNVLGQTLKEIEIICVDDGSTDRSKEILEMYQKKNGNIRVISQNNKGAGPARNAAMDIANGKYVAFMDADDCYADCSVLEMIYSHAERAAVVICGGSLVQEKAGVRDIDDGYLKSRFLSTGIVEYRDYQYVYGYQRFIFQTSFLREHQIQFPPYRRFQDPPFMAKAMISANAFLAIATDVYVYRAGNKAYLFERFDILNDLARGIDDILIMSAAEKLEKLHSDMVQKFLSYTCYFYKSIYRGNVELEVLLERLLLHTDDQLLKEDGRFMQKPTFMKRREINLYLDSIYERERKLWEKIGVFSAVVIYGAGMAGRYLYEYMMQKEYEGTVEFGVTYPKPDETVFGKKVNCIKEYLVRQKEILVLIAAAEENASVMMDYAYELGFENTEKINMDDIKLFQKLKIDL